MYRKLLPSLPLLLALAAPPAEGQILTREFDIGPSADGRHDAGEKYLGSILKANDSTDAPVQRAVSEDWHYYFDLVSPENAAKWGFVELERDVYDWTNLDSCYAYAQDRGLPFTIHSIIREEREPPWLRQLPAEEIREEVEEWIALLAERYPETDYIDVVNEGPHDRLGSDELNAAFGGPGETGWDEVRAIYRLTDQYFPDAQLMLTDFDVIKGQVGDFNIIPIYDEVVRVLVEDGTLDALGPQGHFLGGGKYDSAWVARRLNELSANSGGLPIHITEYDLNAADDDYQRTKYQQTLSAMYAHPDVRGVTLWGYYEGGTWLDNAYVVREDGTERPAMQWLREYLRGEDKDADRLEAEEWDAMFGLFPADDGVPTDEEGDAVAPGPVTTALGGDSAWVRFRHVDLDGADAIALRYRSTGEAQTLSLVLDSLDFAPAWEHELDDTEGAFRTDTFRLGEAYTDVRDVHIVYRGPREPEAFGLDYVSFGAFGDLVNVGAAPLPDDALVVFPNPATDEVTVRVDRAADIQVLDVNGRLVAERRGLAAGQTIPIATDAFPRGMYVVRAVAGDRATVRSLVIR